MGYFWVSLWVLTTIFTAPSHAGWWSPSRSCLNLFKKEQRIDTSRRGFLLKGCAAAVVAATNPPLLLTPPRTPRSPISLTTLKTVYGKRLDLAHSNYFTGPGRILSELFPQFSGADQQTRAEIINEFVKDWMRHDIKTTGSLGSLKSLGNFLKSLGGFGKTARDLQVLSRPSLPLEQLKDLIAKQNPAEITNPSSLNPSQGTSIRDELTRLEDYFLEKEREKNPPEKTEAVEEPGKTTEEPPLLLENKPAEEKPSNELPTDEANHPAVREICDLCPPEE